MRKITFIQLGIAFIIIMGLSTCQKNQPDNTNTDENYTSKGNLLVRNNIEQESTARINFKNELIPIVDDNNPFKSSDYYTNIDPTKNYAFKLKAEVSSPVYEGSVLQATHVILQDAWAFVTYNTRGPVWLGGFEIFDISSVSNPSLIASTIMPVGDISAVAYNSGKLYFVGATGNYEELGYQSAAFLEVVTLDKDMNVQSVDTMLDVPSFAATDVIVTNDHILVTSGSEGGLTVYNKTNFEQINYTEYPDARAIAGNSNHVFLLQGQNGRINKLNALTMESEAVFNVDGATIPESKSEMAVNDNYILAALNDGGLKMLTTDGVLKQHIPTPPTPEGVLEENNVTNSVTLNGDLVLMGNGESGLYVGGMIESMNDSIWMMGSMAFKGDASANFVESSDSVIFVATGLEGLKIISINIDNGIPPDIIPTTPCEGLLTDIASLLPESTDLRKSNPDLFFDTVDLSVYIENETELYITFIGEGADYKNTLGYYSYPADNPPVSKKDLDKHVIFPNASAVNSGGGLEYGDMVKLGETFQPGTVVGFYMIANGWKNGMMVNGYYTFFTDPYINSNAKQQTTLFVTNNCNELVLTFEDLSVTATNCDFDFNDIICLIKDNPDSNVPNSNIRMTGIPVK